MPRETVALGAAQASMSLPQIKRHMLSTIGAYAGSGRPEILMLAGEPPYLYKATSATPERPTKKKPTQNLQDSAVKRVFSK